MVLQHLANSLLVAAVLAPFSFYAGRGAARIGLPQISGYLLSGIITGPYGLGILSLEAVADLGIIEGACLGVIGLAAGAELQGNELARARRQVCLHNPCRLWMHPPASPTLCTLCDRVTECSTCCCTFAD